jgi:hypothetical protein
METRKPIVFSGTSEPASAQRFSIIAERANCVNGPELHHAENFPRMAKNWVSR